VTGKNAVGMRGDTHLPIKNDAAEVDAAERALYRRACGYTPSVSG